MQKNKIDFGTAVFDKKQLLEALEIKCDFIKIAMDINKLSTQSSIKNKNSSDSFNWDGYRERN